MKSATGDGNNFLILNTGSSSIKCSFYQDTKEVIRIALREIHKERELSLWISGKEVQKEIRHFSNIQEQLLCILDIIEDVCHIKRTEFTAIGHRIVHGGPDFRATTLITPSVLDAIEKYSPCAPLHNPAALEVIATLESLQIECPQIAVFDTSFHKTIPEYRKLYPGPYNWKEQGILRYGFHGISHNFCAKRAKEFLLPEQNRLITCHIGAGASLCAVLDGTSLATTMGFTPLDGLMMNTRSGAIDPGILLFLLEEKKYSLEELDRMMNKESGLLGISGISSEINQIIKLLPENPRAQLAIDMYVDKIAASIASFIPSLNGLDALVFTAGIGENNSFIRKQVIETLRFLDITLDTTSNNQNGLDRVISTPQSKISVLVLHADEAQAIKDELITFFRVSAGH